MKKYKKSFSCPLSPYIMWHHGLIYSECPLDAPQRDMGACERCVLNDKATKKQKSKKTKSTPRVEKRKKEPIPNIGKTYTGE